MKHRALAVLVGEPTGQKPNSYGEVRTFELPNSRLVVSHSTRIFRLADHGDPPWYAPDRAIGMTSADLQAGRDPIMDWIQRQEGAEKCRPHGESRFVVTPYDFYVAGNRHRNWWFARAPDRRAGRRPRWVYRAS